MEELLAALDKLKDPAVVATQFITGLSTGMFLVLFSIGLTLIFGVIRVINLAHGCFFMLGAYLMHAVSQHLPGGYWFFLAVLAAGLATAAAGGVAEFTLLRQVYRKGSHTPVMLTFGIVLVLISLVKLVYGADFKQLNRPEFLDGMIERGPLQIPTYNLFILLAVPLILAGVWIFFKHSRFGLELRAASTDRDMLEALGTNVNRLFTKTFMLSTFFSGLAGALSAPQFAISLYMGHSILISSFVVIIIGGVGSIVGSVIGALLVGQIQAFMILLYPEAAVFVMFGLMALVLLIRPTGFFGSAEGRAEEEGVGQ